MPRRPGGMVGVRGRFFGAVTPLVHPGSLEAPHAILSNYIKGLRKEVNSILSSLPCSAWATASVFRPPLLLDGATVLGFLGVLLVLPTGPGVTDASVPGLGGLNCIGLGACGLGKGTGNPGIAAQINHRPRPGRLERRPR